MISKAGIGGGKAIVEREDVARPVAKSAPPPPPPAAPKPAAVDAFAAKPPVAQVAAKTVAKLGVAVKKVEVEVEDRAVGVGKAIAKGAGTVAKTVSTAAQSTVSKFSAPPRSTALSSPAAGRTPSTAGKGDTPTNVGVPWVSQFDEDQVENAGNTACKRTTDVMMGQADQPVKDNGFGQHIEIATSKDENGHISVDSADAQMGRNYIDQRLNDGYPVTVGVADKGGVSANNDGGITNHFVVITGRDVDENGNVYYTFNDPGRKDEDKGSDEAANNRFYVDADTGMLYRAGDPTKTGPDSKTYEVAQVRTNTALPVEPDEVDDDESTAAVAANAPPPAQVSLEPTPSTDPTPSPAPTPPSSGSADGAAQKAPAPSTAAAGHKALKASDDKNVLKWTNRGVNVTTTATADIFSKSVSFDKSIFSAGGSWGKAGGPLYMEGHVAVGQVTASASASAGIDLKHGSFNLGAGVSVGAYAVSASGKITSDLGISHTELGGNAIVGAEGNGKANVNVDPLHGTLMAGVNGEVFAGARAGVQVSEVVGPIGVSAGSKVEVGIGAHMSGNVGFDHGTFSASFNMGAALGIGIDIHIGVSVNVGKIVDGAKDVIKGLGKVGGSIVKGVSDAAGWVKGAASSAVSAVGSAAKSVGSAIGSAASSVGHAISSVFSGW